MQKQILLINDLPGYGKVALSAMIPVLSHMGHHLYNLPTALVSNTPDYGEFEILETTDYMSKTIAVWENLGFTFDAAAVGFVVSETHCVLLYAAQVTRRENFSDFTHARTFAHGGFQRPELHRGDLTKTQAELLIKKLVQAGANSIVVTGAKVDGQDCVIVYDAESNTIDYLPFDYVPVRFPGTGDIFSAIFIGNNLNGADLISSTQRAMDAVRTMLYVNRDNADKFKGIPVESCLEVLNYATPEN